MTLSPRQLLVLNEIHATGDGFLAALEGITEAEWDFKPAPDRWSANETAEHTTLVLQSITKMVTTTLLTKPLPPRESAPRVTDDQIIARLFDRSTRRQAPDTTHPTGRYGGRGSTIEVFTSTREQLDAWVRRTEADLRQYGSPHPVLGTLDGVQWLLFAAAHTERHTRQIKEARELASKA